PMTSTFLAIRSSIARTCSAGSSVVGLMIEASTLRSCPALSTPFSTLSNHGILTLPTTPMRAGLLAANNAFGAAVVATAANAAAPFMSVRREMSRMESSLIQSGQTTSSRLRGKGQAGAVAPSGFPRDTAGKRPGVFFDDCPRARLDVLEVQAHGACRCLGIGRRDRPHDHGVLTETAPDECR